MHRKSQKPVNGRSLVQPKVTIHAADDHYEKEADHVADKMVSNQQVSSASAVSKVSSGTQRKAPTSSRYRHSVQAKHLQKKHLSEHNRNIQKKPGDNSVSSEGLQSADSGPPSAQQISQPNKLTSVLSTQGARGSPMPATTRAQMENRMGAVRIHTGNESHEASKSIGARAFTNGPNIHFANGQYNPNSPAGEHLLAHELTHTIQQSAVATRSNVQRRPDGLSSATNISETNTERGPPVQKQSSQHIIQCSLFDNALNRIGEVLADLLSITDGLAGAKTWLLSKLRTFASFIPGYTALGVVLGQDPITGTPIERNGRNFIEAALDIIPGAGLLKQKLEELGAIEKAANWIDVQLSALGGLIQNVRNEFTNAWNQLGIGSILDGPLNILRTFGNIFENAINNLISFAGRAASELLSIVKQFLLTQVVNFIKNHTTAYELLKVIIGHDPVTKEQVARNGTNILNALLELGGEQGREQRRQMQDTGSFQKAAVTNFPVYQGVNSAGFSRGMKVEKLTKNGSPGSAPAASNSVWQALNLRKQGGRSFYVRGHLVSNSYHGSGSEWRNLVPMFQNHNTAFETKVGSRVKSKYNADGILYFEVVVDYGRPANPNKTAILTSEPDASKRAKLEQIIDAEIHVPSAVTLVVDEFDKDTGQRKMNTIIEEVQFTDIQNKSYSEYIVQTKLHGQHTGDHFEREADHVADKVTGDQKISSPFTVSKISRGIQRKTSSDTVRGPAKKAEKPVSASQATRGSPLPAATRTHMENRMGADFSNVRIHAGSGSQQTNAAMGARAFTQGANIHFAKGEFNPQTKAGKHLLAHELTHTMQQGASSSKRVSSATKQSSSQTIARSQDKMFSPAASARQKKTTPAGKDAAASQGGGGDKVAAGKAVKKKSPSSPEEDPAFQHTIHRANTKAKEQRAHEPATKKAGDAQAAAPPVAYEADSKAQNRKIDGMSEAGKEDRPFDPATFKADLLAKIEEITPKTLEEADDFKEKNRINEVKGDVNSKVAAEKQTTVGPVAQATGQPLKVDDNENKKPVTLPPTEKGEKPGSIGARNAAPKKKTDDEISMQEESASLDDEMKQNNMTENQLQGSNEPSFQSALKEKKNAQKDAVEKPLLFRTNEAAELKAAEAEAGGKAASSLAGMHNARGKNFEGVVTQQNDTKKKDEDGRAKVAKDINDKYILAEKNVNRFLTEAETTSGQIFEKGAEDARRLFEDYADEKMRAYKRERYSGLLGGGYWLHDKFFDLPDEVNAFYVDGKKLYLEKMDKVLTRVANLIAEKLNNAKKAIADGKKDIDQYVKDLPDNLATVGQETAEQVQDKFDSLEQSVKDKGQQLVDGLARKYVDNVKKLDERITELKEVNKGLISKAIGLLKAVWEAIKNIYNLFKTILSKLVQIIGVIIGAPGKFFGNLGAAFNKGFDMFKSRLDEHLENGLMIWLGTQLGVPDLKLPPKFDITAIFSMVLQVMGISYAHIRERAVLQIGEERVALLETTAGVFQRIYKEGLGAVWDIIQEKFTDFKDMIWEAIKTFIRDAVIRAAITFVLSLLNPIAAFIKACMAIYDFLMMLVRMKDRIIELLNSILDAVMTIATGSVDAAAAAIEKAFAKSIPIIIGFLAALLHLNNIGAKVRDIILRIRAKVDKLIDWMISKAYALVSPAVEAAMRIKNKGKELIDKGKEKLVGVGKNIVGAVSNWWKSKKSFSAEGESHSLYFTGENQSARLMVASKPMDINAWLIHRESDLTKSDKLDTTKKSAIEHIRHKLIPEMDGITHAQNSPPPRNMDAVLNELAEKVKIIGIKNVPPVPHMIVSPGFSDKHLNGKLVIKFLFNHPDNHHEGEGTSGKESVGGAFEFIQDAGLSSYWSRGHILNKDFGGKAVNSNLVPIEQSTNVKQISFDNSIRKEFLKGDAPVYILFNVVRHGADTRFISSYTAEAKTMKANEENWTETGGDFIKSFDAPKIELPASGEKISINSITTDSSRDAIRKVGKANNLSPNLLNDIIASGTVINSAAGLKAFIEKTYTGQKKQGYLNRVELAEKNNMLDFG